MGRIWKSPCGMMELREGRWQDVLQDVTECDAVITDPPYSERTQAGHDDAANMANDTWHWERPSGGKDRRRRRRSIDYSWLTPDDVREWSRDFAGMASGWVVALSDSCLAQEWRSAMEEIGRYAFQPVACVMRGMTVRLCGDGPSSWTIYANVARPRSMPKWGTLPGAYVHGQGERIHIGGKPLALMCDLVSDYSREGDLVVDPCAGAGTTLLAAAIEGRRCIGAEMDPKTFDLAVNRLSKGYTPRMRLPKRPKPKQKNLL